MTQSDGAMREQKLTTLFLLALVAIGAAILIYGEIVNSDGLSIFGAGIMLPTLLPLLFNLGVYLMGVERTPPSQPPPTGPSSPRTG